MNHHAVVLGVAVVWRRLEVVLRAALLGLLGAVWLSSGLAFAQQAEPSEGGFHVEGDPDAVAAEARDQDAAGHAASLVRAREAFLEGRQLMAEERWMDAAAAFEIALRAQPTPGLHYHVGICLEWSGDALGARGAYLAARQMLAAQPAPDVAVLLPAALERVEGKLSRFEVAILPKAAVVRLDGVTLAAPYPEWIKPGRHAVRAEAEGYELVDLRFEAVAGAPVRIQATLKPLPQAPVAAAVVTTPPAKPLEEPPPRSALPRTMFWGSVAFGALGLAAGMAGTVWQQDASARVAEANAELPEGDYSACYGPPDMGGGPCERLRVATADSESATILMVGGFVAAGVGVAGALASWAIWPREDFAVSGRAGFGSVHLEVRGRF